MSIPRRIRRHVPNSVPIGAAVWQLPQTFELGTDGKLGFSLCPFPDEPSDVNQIWCQSDSFPRLLNWWPPKTPQVPSLCFKGQFVWRISIPIWICTCVPNLCQSAQPFRSFSRICAKVSLAFHRCTRWLAQKHAKKQHLYIDHFNSGPNMQTSTSLTFFTAIFVAFSGELAEQLMIFCLHVRT